MKCVLAVLLAAILSSPASAANHIQLLKAYGHLPAVSLDELDAAVTKAELVDLVLTGRECGCPDQPDKDIAESTPDELSDALGLPPEQCANLILSHQRMLEATGRGSWPASCWPEYPNNHSVRYYLDRESFPAHMKRAVTDNELRDVVRAGVWGVDIEQARKQWAGKPMLDVALELVDESYRRAGCAHIQEPEHAKANVHVRSLPIPGSVIGVAWFNNGTCGDHVEHRIDSGYRPGLHSLAALLCHEFGHNHNLPHTFSGQERHHGVMSYSSRNPFQGYRTGQETSPGYPRDPSWSQLTRQYGNEEAPGQWPPGTTPEPPTPPTGDFPIEQGDEIVILVHGRKITTAVESVDGDDGPGLADRVAKAVDAIEDYPQKEKHRTSLLLIYQATSEAVEARTITIEEGKTGLIALRGLLLGGSAGKWSEVFALADSINSPEGLSSVAKGLAGGEALSPEIVAIIKLIVQLLPEGRLKTIVTIILTILETIGQDVEAVSEPERVKIEDTDIFEHSHWTDGKISYGSS